MLVTADPRAACRVGLIIVAFAGCSSDSSQSPGDDEPAPDARPDGPVIRGSFALEWTITGPSEASNFGLSLSDVGDVDGDAAGDFAVTDWMTNHVSVRSGRTGAPLYTLAPVGAKADLFGNSISAVGDVNGDLTPDFAITAWTANADTGRVTLHSGDTGTVIRTFNGQAQTPYLRVAGIGDVNNDGTPDIAVGAPGATRAGNEGAGAVVVLSGTNGAVLASFDGGVRGDEPISLGSSIAAVGDLNGDGRPDLIAGAQFDGAGSARVLLPATMAALRTLSPPADINALGFGFSAAGGRDVDGDGTPDVAVGCAQCSVAGKVESGFAGVFSGATGQLIDRAVGEAAADGFGANLAMIPDIDGDGRAEWIGGAPTPFIPSERNGYVEIRSAGVVLARLDGPEPRASFGSALAVSDFTGDGLPDLLIGASGAADNAGQVMLFAQRR